MIRRNVVIATILVGIGAFGTGWIVRGAHDHIVPAKSLRLGGYQFIDPLLACNINNSNVFQKDMALNGQIQSLIDAHTNAGDISKASVYFVNTSNGSWINVYGNEAYYPSSLGKVPIMIAYYEFAQSDPSILNKEITYPVGSTDLNQEQGIKPAKSIVPGETYTVGELIGYMIKYSDNNASQLLYGDIDRNLLNHVYGDLGIPVKEDATLEDLDFIKTQQVATLFRILYNATYISRDYSEQALRLLSQTSFTEGIVAGVPHQTVVSHKLGLVEIAPGGVVSQHELHDCGIVYAKNPYLLCVMTRGSADLQKLESIIAQISKIAYDHVNSQ